jgi:hypothetical protein
MEYGLLDNMSSEVQTFPCLEFQKFITMLTKALTTSL